MVGSGHIVFAWVMTVFSFGYFLPWAIAATRQRSNAAAIGVLNLFVGCTVSAGPSTPHRDTDGPSSVSTEDGPATRAQASRLRCRMRPAVTKFGA